MKLITKNLTQSCPGPFFLSPSYSLYRDVLEDFKIDRSITYHDGGTKLYMIEIVPDQHVEMIKGLWNEVVVAEKFDVRGIAVVEGMTDALDKK